MQKEVPVWPFVPECGWLKTSKTKNCQIAQKKKKKTNKQKQKQKKTKQKKTKQKKQNKKANPAGLLCGVKTRVTFYEARWTKKLLLSSFSLKGASDVVLRLFELQVWPITRPRWRSTETTRSYKKTPRESVTSFRGPCRRHSNKQFMCRGSMTSWRDLTAITATTRESVTSHRTSDLQRPFTVCRESKCEMEAQ